MIHSDALWKEADWGVYRPLYSIQHNIYLIYIYLFISIYPI